MDRYHDLADATMDTLLGSLEDLLEILGNREYEVEYHVRMRSFLSSSHRLDMWLRYIGVHF